MTGPRLVVFAGPNGSGKSTLTRRLIERDLLPTEHIDPDRIAAESGGPGTAATPASLLKASRLRETWLRERRDFCFETVLSHPRWLDFIERARSLGYDVSVYYIGIGDPIENVARVRIRTLQNGHFVPDHVVVERWTRSMALLADVARIADRTIVFDNGARDLDAAIRPVAVARRRDGMPHVEIFPGAPTWVSTYLRQRTP